MGFPTKEGVVRESVYFNGYKYNRYPEAKQDAHRRYFSKSGGRGLLHRHVWEFHNGSIPKGYQIHHKDGNTLNNDISNLVCLSTKDHRQEHMEEILAKGRSPKRLEHLAKIREKAAEWHKSEDGKAWHKQHGANSWKNRKAVKHTCQECGAEFESLKTTQIGRAHV